MTCRTTHHHACECREQKFSQLEAENATLLTALHAARRLIETQKPVPNRRAAVTGPFDTREQLRDAVQTMIGAGMCGRDIAKALGVSDTTVSRIKHGDKPQRDGGLPVSAASRGLTTQWARG